MMNGNKRVRGTFAAAVLLAASLAAAPAIAKRPPPPPPPTDPDPWLGCTPWGSVMYDVDCCDYPLLEIPCQGPNPPLPPVIYPLESESESEAARD